MDANTAMLQLLQNIDDDLNTIIDTLQWKGQYARVIDNIDPNFTQEYPFVFPVRFINVSADQPISIYLNDDQNPPIDVDLTEMPFNLPSVYPNMNIRSIFIKTKTNPTQVKIFAIG
jgi:hypothetical protein